MRKEVDEAAESLSKARNEFESLTPDMKTRPQSAGLWDDEPDQDITRQKSDGLLWVGYYQGVVNSYGGKYEMAIRSFVNCTKSASALLANRALAHCYMQMGGCFYKLGNHKEAYCHFQMARFLFQESGSIGEINDSLTEFPEFRGIGAWIDRLDREFDHSAHLRTCGYRKCKFQAYCVAS
jgi:hypothetical protein